MKKAEITLKVLVDVPDEMDIDSIHVVNQISSLMLMDGFDRELECDVVSFETDWVEEC